MPTDPSKQAQQVLEIPAGTVSASTINDRIQQINLAFQRFLQNPALADADFGQQRLVNLADPKDDLDGVNLRTLKKFSGTGIAEDVTGGTGIEQPTIYFTFDGLPFDNQDSPYAMIMANRSGFAPTAISVSAVVAPVSAPAEVNVVLYNRGNLLTVNLALPIGSIGPVFSSAIALPAGFPKGTLLQAHVAIAGGCSQLTVGVALRGKAA